MTISLFDHQKEALAWMKKRETEPMVLSNGDRVCGGLLCDEMGLGKTYTTMALIAGSAKHQQSASQTLIVAPLPLLDNWIAASRAYNIEPYVFDSKRGAWISEKPIQEGQTLLKVPKEIVITASSFQSLPSKLTAVLFFIFLILGAWSGRIGSNIFFSYY
jgi:hypothetical protein